TLDRCFLYHLLHGGHHVMTAKQTAPKRVKVTLIEAHTHRGRPCEKGEEIEVTENQRDWLIKHKKVAAPGK
ncbi:hypothetical protein MO867_20545, partial [Microbulbifer sp. OS29]